MKLRNKRTGEIIDFSKLNILIEYNSLAELNEEWEDYEEPKEYWFIDWVPKLGVYHTTDLDCKDDNSLKQIGNYFNTREEAEKAVEKLKAWKLLKDECDIKFDGIIRDDKEMIKGVKLIYDRHEVTIERMRECMDGFHLLFGGEE